MIKIFISSPMSTQEDIDNLNILSMQLQTLFSNSPLDTPIRIINPYMYIHKGSREDYLKESVKLLIDCDTVVFADNYEKAIGCLLEKEIAIKCGLNIVHQKDIENITIIEN